MKKLIVLVVMCVVPFYSAYAEETAVNIAKALDLVYSNNPAIRQAQEAVNASKARLGGKKSGYYPVIAIEAAYAHLDPDPVIDFPGLGALQLFPVDNYDAHASLRQTLWDSGRTSSAARAAGYSFEAARKNLELVKISLTFQTIQAFYSVLLLEQSVAVQQQQMDSLQEALDLTTKKIASGSSTQFDELTTRVKLAEAESQKIDIVNMLRKQQITLSRLMGLDVSGTLKITGEFADKTFELDENALITAAKQDRAELKMAKDNENAAKSQLSASGADNYPTLSADLSYGYKNGYLPELEAIKQNTVAAAQLSFPLFNGLKTYNQVAESKANYAAARERSLEAEDMIVAEVRQAVSEARASMDKIKATELHVQLAQEALKQAKVRYESGVITNLDLLNAETSLAQANFLRLQALYNYTLSRVALNKAVGAELLKQDK